MKKIALILALTLAAATLAVAYERTMTEAEQRETEACRALAIEEGWIVKKVSLCNRNLFSPNVYLIEPYRIGDRRDVRQCKIESGYVRILSGLAQWEC